MTTEEQLYRDKMEVARNFLKNTDWLMIRKYEKGTAVPAAILAKREECIEFLTSNPSKEILDIVFYSESDIDKALENLVDLRESALEVDFVNGTFTKK